MIGLDSTFNGTPEGLGTAVGLMFQCKNRRAN
jgi:hypothetical protein